MHALQQIDLIYLSCIGWDSPNSRVTGEQDSTSFFVVDTKLNAAEPSSTNRLCQLWTTDSFKSLSQLQSLL